MSAQPQDFTPADRLPEKNLNAIRAALVVPQDRQAFDTGLDLVLAEVRATLDITKLNEFVHVWWLIACDSLKDPQGRVAMYGRATHLQDLAAHGASLPRGDKTWRELFAERGIELQVYSLDEPDPQAQTVIAALPDDAVRPLAEAYKVLMLAPWNGTPLKSGNPDSNMLTIPFGERGLVTYLVLEEQRKVCILRVQWI